jgi:hypothetical protein
MICTSHFTARELLVPRIVDSASVLFSAMVATHPTRWSSPPSGPRGSLIIKELISIKVPNPTFSLSPSLAHHEAQPLTSQSWRALQHTSSGEGIGLAAPDCCRQEGGFWPTRAPQTPQCPIKQATLAQWNLVALETTSHFISLANYPRLAHFFLFTPGPLATLFAQCH